MTEDAQSWSSSMETGPSGESFLQKIFRRLSTTQCLKLGANEAAPVAVVSVQRYLSEQPEEGQPGSYSYDVTVTDGAFRAKCLLHATLNHLVHVNELRTGGDVTVTRWSLVYNERRLGRGYVCIEGVSCNEGASAVLARVSCVHALPRASCVHALPVLVARGVGPHGHAPLQLGRKHYLPLWNNDDPEGDIWSSGPPPSDTVLDVSRIALLSSLESSFRTSWKPLPLLVRIIHKSRLRYYGKFGLKIDFPYQAYYEVADQSGSMSMVLWNELCPDFYRRLDVGTVLLLQDYTLKQSYSHRSRPQMDHHRMKSFTSVEICLNPRKPASVITVVSPKKVQPDWGLPEVCYRFAAR
ncbi:unnamed protein product [Menidia menidia]|uniref:(Atlantic silverside) hypothetical protein n=1 Tax=Menidia menidia TaxID=238744 RepID=A0A8S4AJQ2_9TELE|nr:unnamed protein product [Menidia menidia]